MATSVLNIEEIVQSVLKQIQTQGQNAAIHKSQSQPESKSRNKPEKLAAEKYLSQAVITADLLAEIVQPGEQVTVAEKAIVTPAAVDYLKEKKIQLERITVSRDEKPGSAMAVPAGKKTWLGLLVETSAVFDAAIKSVQKNNGTNFVIQKPGSTEEAAKMAISEINRGATSGVFLVTNRVATACCLANRHERIRAVAVNRTADLEAIAELNANVICLPERGPGISDYLQILRKVTQG